MITSEYGNVPAPSHHGGAGTNPSIYIVEDNDDNLFLYEWIFTRHLPGYAYHLFPDGLSLQQHLGSAVHKPDVILLDLKMPFISGTQLLTQLKQNPLWKHIPVVIFTHSTSPKEKEECYKAGASDFINKEISVHGIRAQIETVCRQWIKYGRRAV